MADLVSQLRDVNTTESRIAQSIATGAFTTFVSPTKLSPRTRTTIHGLSGLLGGAAGAFVLTQRMRVPQRTAAGIAVGGLFFGISALGLVVDEKAESWLRAKGVRRPRLWMGVVAGVLTWVTSAPEAPEDTSR